MGATGRELENVRTRENEVERLCLGMRIGVGHGIVIGGWGGGGGVKGGREVIGGCFGVGLSDLI